MKILLFGGSGLLGTELQKLDSEIIAPPRSKLNLNDSWNLKKMIHETRPDIVINAAALKNNSQIEQNPQEAIKVNVIAASHISLACQELGIRLAYISTDYIYKGDKGNYREEDEILPFNLYSWLKLGGECATRAVRNHLIIRTSFGSSEFEHGFAFSDKYTSKDYVDVIAPMILKAIKSKKTGVLNIGSPRTTIYEYAKKRNPHIHPIEVIKNSNFTTPKDTSLNLQQWLILKSEINE